MRLRALRQIELDTPQRFSVCVRVCLCMCVTQGECVLMFFMCLCVQAAVFCGWLLGLPRVRVSVCICVCGLEERAFFLMVFTSFRKWTNVMALNSRL